MLRLVLTLLIVMLPTVGRAADPNLGQEIIGPGDVLRGHFTEERHMKGFNGPMRSEGHFVVVPSRGLIWGIDKPFPTATVITPSGLIQTVGGVKVMYLPAQKVPFLLHLYDMLGGALAGNWKPLETDFDITQSSDTDGWLIMLSPRRTNNPAMPFNSITISGHRFVENVTLLKPDGDSDTLVFKDEVLSQAPPATAESTAFNSVHP